ncbi:hypothetical protein KDA_19410 [Dictyobacter alpinus]|uniref:Uncharacterized protein n=1 Tax=Dictyobacter alpinus TaxID=2014873 RepID=A0A402B536_9CHLR|nr:hypothetical protein KDA_19410 [Dictyobacter alpinus]
MYVCAVRAAAAALTAHTYIKAYEATCKFIKTKLILLCSNRGAGLPLDWNTAKLSERRRRENYGIAINII